MKPADSLSAAELGDEIRSLGKSVRVRAKADAAALGFEDRQTEAGAAVANSAFDSVDAAAPGVFSRDDYVSGISVPKTTVSTSTFDQVFSDLKSAFLAIATGDLNLVMALSLREAIAGLRDLEVVATVFSSDALKISVAAAAGLLTPPSRADVQSLKSDAESLSAEVKRAAADLDSAPSRRLAAKRRAGVADESSPEELPEAAPELGLRPGRVVTLSKDDPSVLDADRQLFAPQPAASNGLSAEASRTSVVDQAVSDKADKLEASALSRVQYLAICQALSVLDAGEENRRKAEEALERIASRLASVEGLLSPTFEFDLLAAGNELASKAIGAIAQGLQSKIDAMDQFLSLATFQPPTFVSTVQNIGDTASNVSLAESLLASCGLRMDSFCQFQGLIEVAKSLDAELGLKPIRPVAYGKVCFSVQVPEPGPDEITVQDPLPDREASLILTSTLLPSDVELTARVPVSAARRAVTSGVPRVNVTFGLIQAGAESVTVTLPQPSPVAGVGRVTLGSETLRYSSATVSGVLVTLSLIDRPTSSHAPPENGSLDSEHRDNFTSVYRPEDGIGGGPGVLLVGGDAETAETIEYTGSSFSTTTGEYVFALGSRTSPSAHLMQVTGVPADSVKRALFRAPGDIRPAPRFNVTGSTVTPVTPGSPADMSSEISPGDWIVVGGDPNETPVLVQSVSPGSVTLSQPYHGGAVSGVQLISSSEVTQPGSSHIYARIDRRAMSEIGLAASPGVQQKECWLLASQGQGTKTKTFSGVTAAHSSGVTQEVTLPFPGFFPDDQGMAVTITTSNGRLLTLPISTYLSDSSVAVNLTAGKIQGTASRSGASVTGSSTRFLSEVQPGDCLVVNGVATKVSSVASDTSLTTVESGAVTSGDVYQAAAGASPSTGLTVSFRRLAPETLYVSSFERTSPPQSGAPDSSAVWRLSLQTPTTKPHQQQSLSVSPTVQIQPQAQLAFAQAPTVVDFRFEPDAVPPGATVIRGALIDPGQSFLLELLAISGGVIEIDGRQIPYQSLEQQGDETVFTLSQPLDRSISSGSRFCVLTASTVESLLLDLLPGGEWRVSFDNWLAALADQMTQLHRRLCRLLQGRPEDLASVAAAIAAGASLAASSALAFRLTLEAVLGGLGGLGKVDPVIAKAKSAGMDRAAKAMANGDLISVAQMKPNQATESGALASSINAYRQKLTRESQALKADNLAAQLKGNETSSRVLAETRAGFRIAAKEDIDRRLRAADRLQGEIGVLTDD